MILTEVIGWFVFAVLVFLLANTKRELPIYCTVEDRMKEFSIEELEEIVGDYHFPEPYREMAHSELKIRHQA